MISENCPESASLFMNEYMLRTEQDLNALLHRLCENTKVKHSSKRSGLIKRLQKLSLNASTQAGRLDFDRALIEGILEPYAKNLQLESEFTCKFFAKPPEFKVSDRVLRVNLHFTICRGGPTKTCPELMTIWKWPYEHTIISRLMKHLVTWRISSRCMLGNLLENFLLQSIRKGHVKR